MGFWKEVAARSIGMRAEVNAQMKLSKQVRGKATKTEKAVIKKANKREGPKRAKSN